MSLQRHYLHIPAPMVMLSCAAGLLLSNVNVSSKKHLGLILQHTKIVIDHLQHLKAP